ncbi:MAG: esterase family protein [Selenomonadaceae bacterium]|nr:esterase family protein [Selenomonadaceae bacterium]
MTIKTYGAGGLPILVFPTQDAMSDNFENFGMIDTLKDFIDGGAIQLFCVDTVDQETWSNVWGDKVWRAARQENYYRYIIEEVLPLIREKNSSGKLPIVTGCSLGGLHAAIIFLRRPELFGGMLSLSGVYDAKFFFDGWSNPVLYDNSPTDFLANISLNHPYIKLYNAKKIILCVGQGRWEEEGLRTTAIMRDIFKAKNISAQTDFWGFDVDHDWCWWKRQMIYFLPQFLEGTQ